MVAMVVFCDGFERWVSRKKHDFYVMSCFEFVKKEKIIPIIYYYVSANSMLLM